MKPQQRKSRRGCEHHPLPEVTVLARSAAEILVSKLPRGLRLVFVRRSPAATVKTIRVGERVTVSQSHAAKTRCRAGILLVFALACSATTWGQAEMPGQTPSGGVSNAPDYPVVASARGVNVVVDAPGLAPQGGYASPAVVIPRIQPAASVQWKSLMQGSMFYMGVMHSFRLATEQGTRDALHNSVVGGYFKALGAMHGWSDGDGYYEGYLGHPIEGAVSGYIWIHNDPRYRNVQFGMDRNYWMSRLRAYAFAWAFSEQFEIGPISEASIGQIQRYCCAYGFVDHVITPNGGLVWMLAGDAIDRYVTVPMETRSKKRIVRILARSVFNPPQTFANMMMFHAPWHRENRDGIETYSGQIFVSPSKSVLDVVNPEKYGFNDIPRFEIAATVPTLHAVAGLNCLGGGGVGGLRVSDFWQWTIEVGGCTLGNSLPHNWSGDSLTFTTGPQWIVHTLGRWSPHAHFRIGGQKITEEYQDSRKKQQVVATLGKSAEYRDLYTQHWESTGFSFSTGAGLDFAINRGLAVRIAEFEYVRSWLGNLNGRNFDRSFRLNTGLVLRVGTW